MLYRGRGGDWLGYAACLLCVQLSMNLTLAIAIPPTEPLAMCCHHDKLLGTSHL